MYLRVRKGQVQKDLACQEALQVSHVRVGDLGVGDLGMPQALGVGRKEGQEPEREGKEG